MDIEKNNYLIELFDQYSNLLTKKQVLYLDYYLKYDLSLGEIADNLNVSRSACFDLISRSIKKLNDYENRMRLVKNKKKIIDSITSSNLNKEVLIKMIEEL